MSVGLFGWIGGIQKNEKETRVVAALYDKNIVLLFPIKGKYDGLCRFHLIGWYKHW